MVLVEISIGRCRNDLRRRRRAIRKLLLVARAGKSGGVRGGDTSQEERTTNGRKGESERVGEGVEEGVQ